MLYPSIDMLLEKVGSKYLLVNLVTKRSEEMVKHNHYQLPKDDYKSSSNIGKALEEVAKDLVHLKN